MLLRVVADAGKVRAMGRPSDWWVLDLTQDPTPGDPGAVRRLAKTFSDFAYDVASAEQAISGMGSNDVISQWVGDSGDAFRSEFNDFPPDLKKLHTSYDLCAQALEAYAPKLEAAQQQADQALAQGRDAHSDLQRAQSQLTGAQDWMATANKQAQQYQNQPASAPKPDPTQVAAATRNAQAASAAQSQAQGAVDAAQARLNAAKTLAGQAEQARLSAARQCADDIHKASDAGIHNLHWWQKAFNWVADHWGQIITVLKVIAFVLAIVVLIVGGPLAWVLVGISAVLTMNALVNAIEGKGSWWDVLFSALGCIPVTEGLTSLGALRDAFEAGGLLGAGAHVLGAGRDAVMGMVDVLKAGGGKLVTKLFGDGADALSASMHSGTATAADFARDFPEIADVNPRFPQPGFTQNCPNCGVATDLTLAGRPASAMPLGGGGLGPIQALYRSTFQDVNSFNDIASQIAQGGDGARGIIAASRVDAAGNPVMGHIFNVVNKNGVVSFIDGQSNGFANLSGYSSIKFLRTN